MAKLQPEFKQPGELSESDIIAIVAIGREQAQLMDQLEVALEACDDLRALGVARRLVDLEKQVKKEQ